MLSAEFKTHLAVCNYEMSRLLTTTSRCLKKLHLSGVILELKEPFK